MTPTLEQLADVVRREIGVSIGSEQLASLQAALRRVDPTLDAATFLDGGVEQANAEELLDRLIDEVTVNETYFLRQPDQLRTIDWHALKARAEAAGSPTVRVWVAACATGEEAYTLAMLASEAFGSAAPPVSILGTDISTAALRRAGRGRYRGRALRALDREARERYFVPAGDELVVEERLRRLVELERHNLVQASRPPRGEQRFDLITCRNVLIYFDGDTVERVIDSLERALAPGGTLVLGAADRLCGSARRLAALERRAPAAVLPTAADGEPAVPLRRPLGHVDRAVPASLADALNAADEGRLDDAVSVTTRLLDEDALDADAHFVRGLAELGRDRSDAAVASLRRALFIDPTFGPAAFQLGRAQEARGDGAAATRAYEQALRTLEPGNERHEAFLAQVDVGDVAAACAIRLRALRDRSGEGQR